MCQKWPYSTYSATYSLPEIPGFAIVLSRAGIVLDRTPNLASHEQFEMDVCVMTTDWMVFVGKWR